MAAAPPRNDHKEIPYQGSPILHSTQTPILHIQVQVRNHAANKLRFSSYAHPYSDTAGKDIDAFVKSLASKPTVGASRAADSEGFSAYLSRIISSIFQRISWKATPLDILVDRKCFLVIELDPTVNWEFETYSYGVTTKIDDNFLNDENGRVVYALANEVIKPEDIRYGSGAPAGCRVLYFSVYRRRRHPGPPIAENVLRGFNFHVDFIQKIVVNNVTEEHRMPTVFDPNVPNTGGSEFP